ncbi:MAG: NUDIX hydrolase [Polyangiales bacterium]
MPHERPLRAPPSISLHVVEDLGEQGAPGFLRVRRRRLSVRYLDGTTSAAFPYDATERTNLDAVAVIPHYRVSDGEHVLLRSCVRPPLALRSTPFVDPAALPDGVARGSLWEIVAGLVEADERTRDGLRSCAARELREELGFVVDPARVAPLGTAITTSAGVIGELVHLFSCRLDSPIPGEVIGDGSPLEVGGEMLDVLLSELVEACDRGQIVDAKTEIAARRLERVLSRTTS